jgi:hypothetical protein
MYSAYNIPTNTSYNNIKIIYCITTARVCERLGGVLMSHVFLERKRTKVCEKNVWVIIIIIIIIKRNVDDDKRKKETVYFSPRRNAVQNGN